MRRILMRIFTPIKTEYSRFIIYFERIHEIASLIGFFRSYLRTNRISHERTCTNNLIFLVVSSRRTEPVKNDFREKINVITLHFFENGI